MTVLAEPQPAAEPARLADWTEFLAAGARFYMTLNNSATLEWFLASPDPQTREMGEALVAVGQGSFAPSDAERGKLRAIVSDACARRGIPASGASRHPAPV
jgi:hypothetical protein